MFGMDAMRLVLTVVITVLILAALGQIMRNHYVAIPLVYVGAIWLAYRLSSPSERREFRVFVPRLMRRLRLRGRGRRPSRPLATPVQMLSDERSDRGG